MVATFSLTDLNRQRLETQDDLSPLNDANFVTQVLSSMPLASSSSSGKPWPGLGVKRDVLLLDQSRASRSQPQQQTDGDHQTQYQSSALPSIPATSPRADNEGGFATHHQLTTSELQAQTKTSIMDRPRGIRRGGDPAGDGTAGGFNYGYDNSGQWQISSSLDQYPSNVAARLSSLLCPQPRIIAFESATTGRNLARESRLADRNPGLCGRSGRLLYSDWHSRFAQTHHGLPSWYGSTHNFCFSFPTEQDKPEPEYRWSTGCTLHRRCTGNRLDPSRKDWRRRDLSGQCAPSATWALYGAGA